MSITPVQGATEFTTEMLAKNFVTIDQHIDRLNNWVGDLDLGLAGLYKHISTLETRIDGLTPAKAFVKTSGRKRMFVAVAGLSFYCGYKLSDRSNRERLVRRYNESVEKLQAASEQAAQKARQTVEESKSANPTRPDSMRDPNA